MDPVFTLPYSEYAVVEEISQHLGKKEGFSIYVPASRQEKNVDFLVHSTTGNKSVRFQVKSSRSYVTDDPRQLDRGHLKYTLWFSNFRNKYSPGNAEYYILFGLYPHTVNSAVRSRSESWLPLILCIPDIEMGAILDSVKTKKEGKPDKFFYVSFDTPDRAYGTRGFPSPRDLTKYLLKGQIANIKKELTSNTAIKATGL